MFVFERCGYVACVEVQSSQVASTEVVSAQCHTRQRGVRQITPQRRRTTQHRVSEIGTREVCVGEIGSNLTSAFSRLARDLDTYDDP